MNNKLLVSVVLSIYNDAKTLENTIESVLSQTYNNFELCIIDDGSTDNSIDIVQSYLKKDNRIVFVPFTIHRGLTASLNELLKHTKGEYIARIDADDICLSNRLEMQVKFLNTHSSVMLCGSWGYYIDNNGKRCGEKKMEVDSIKIKNKLLWNNQFIHSSWMFRKNILNEIGFYDESFKKSQDYEFILRIAKKNLVANIPEYLVEWRLRNDSLSWNNREQELYAIKARWWAITKYSYPIFYGLFCILIRCLYLVVPLSIKRRRYAH